ncbi:MAG: c-type cytochrome [Bacillota bacterium]
MKAFIIAGTIWSAAAAGMLLPQQSLAVDAEAAQKLTRAEGCLRCHGIDRGKDGPAYKEVAAKYKGKPDAEAKLTQHLSSGHKVKFPDGHEEDHKIPKTKDTDQIKNVIQWILSL